MNELLARRLTNKVMGYGIPRHMAKEIVDTALEASKGGDNVHTYIDYAMTLVYGFNTNVSSK